MYMTSMQNRSNFDAHFTGTGPEIWRQMNGEVSAFVAGAGPSTAVSSTDRSDAELG
jgi:cysteine synthase